MFSQNVAAQFGLKGNPFDSSALSTNNQALLPIATAFVGRENFPPYLIRTLSAQEAKEILSRDLNQQITSVLTPKELEVLQAVGRKQECTGAEIARDLKMPAQNVSRAFKELERHHFIRFSRVCGKKVFYTLNDLLKIIHEKPASSNEASHALSDIQKQFLTLLESREKLTIPEFCQHTHTPVHRVRSEVKELWQNGFLEKRGFTRGTCYTRPAKTR
jgi:DNA-binding MarR family transcriptional regulator